MFARQGAFPIFFGEFGGFDVFEKTGKGELRPAWIDRFVIGLGLATGTVDIIGFGFGGKEVDGHALGKLVFESEDGLDLGFNPVGDYRHIYLEQFYFLGEQRGKFGGAA